MGQNLILSASSRVKCCGSTGSGRKDTGPPRWRKGEGMERSKLPARRLQCGKVPPEGRAATFSGLLFKSTIFHPHGTLESSGKLFKKYRC